MIPHYAIQSNPYLLLPFYNHLHKLLSGISPYQPLVSQTHIPAIRYLYPYNSIRPRGHYLTDPMIKTFSKVPRLIYSPHSALNIQQDASGNIPSGNLQLKLLDHTLRIICLLAAAIHRLGPMYGARHHTGRHNRQRIKLAPPVLQRPSAGQDHISHHLGSSSATTARLVPPPDSPSGPTTTLSRLSSMLRSMINKRT
jgi:hypothetical protein